MHRSALRQRSRTERRNRSRTLRGWPFLVFTKMLSRAKSPASCLATRCHFDLDLHRRLDQSADEGRGRRTCSAEILPENRRELVEVALIYQVVMDAYYVIERAACLLQGSLDVAKRLARLRLGIRRNGHGGVVVTGRAGHEDPVAVHHSTAKSCDFLEARARGDQLPRHGWRLVSGKEVIARRTPMTSIFLFAIRC